METESQAAERRVAAFHAQDRPWEAALLAFACGVVPVVLAVMFGLYFGLVLLANVVGAIVAAWRSSNVTGERIGYGLPLLILSLGVSFACWDYLGETSVNASIHIDELILPCVKGAIPGGIAFYIAFRLLSRRVPA